MKTTIQRLLAIVAIGFALIQVSNAQTGPIPVAPVAPTPNEASPTAAVTAAAENAATVAADPDATDAEKEEAEDAVLTAMTNALTAGADLNAVVEAALGSNPSPTLIARAVRSAIASRTGPGVTTSSIFVSARNVLSGANLSTLEGIQRQLPLIRSNESIRIESQGSAFLVDANGNISKAGNDSGTGGSSNVTPEAP